MKKMKVNRDQTPKAKGPFVQTGVKAAGYFDCGFGRPCRWVEGENPWLTAFGEN